MRCLLLAALARLAFAYPGGWTSSCIDAPSHGAPQLSSSSFSLRLLDSSDTAVTSYTAGGSYFLELSRGSSSFKGWLAGVYRGASVSSMAALIAGSLAPTGSNSQSAWGCAGTVTQTSRTARSSVRWAWTPPPAGTGRVTAAVIVVTSYSGGWAKVTASFNEAAVTASPSPALPSPSSSASTHPMPSSTATPSATRGSCSQQQTLISGIQGLHPAVNTSDGAASGFSGCGLLEGAPIALFRLSIGAPTGSGLGTLRVDTCGLSTSDTVLALGTGACASDASSFTCAAQNDNACRLQSWATLITPGDAVVTVALGGAGGSSVLSGLRWRWDPPSPSRSVRPSRSATRTPRPSKSASRTSSKRASRTRKPRRGGGGDGDGD